MVNEYGDAGEVLERESSTEAAGVQQQEQQPQQVDLGDFIRSVMREESEVQSRRQQSFTDRALNEIRGFGQRLEALEGRLGATEEIKDLVSDLHELGIDADVREKRALDRKIAKLEKAEQPKPQPQQAAAEQPSDWGTISVGLEKYARAKGFTVQEMRESNWMGRLHAVGLPVNANALPLSEYSAELYKAMDALANQEAAKRRGRTVVPAITTAGGGSNRRFTRAQIDAMSPQEYAANREAIMASLSGR